MATHGTHAGEGDEPHYLAIAHSIAFDFDLDLSNNYGHDEPLIGGGGLEPDGHARLGAGDVLRPVHDVGLPFLFAPFSRIGVPLVSWLSTTLSPDTMRRLRVEPPTLYKHYVSAVMILMAALLAAQLRGAFLTLGVEPREALRWAVLVALSSPLLVMSISFFTEIVSALLAFLVFRRLVERETLDLRTWLLCGATTGLLLLVHARNAGLVAGLLLLGALPLLRRRAFGELACFGGGFAALFAVRTAVNYRFWGTWITSPHARPGEWTGIGPFASELARRTAGMLFDQEFGLLLYAPVFLLVPFGLVVLARTHPRVFRGIALVASGYLLMVLLPLTNAHGWTGGWSPAARFWVPVVPLLALAVVAAAGITPRLAGGARRRQVGLNAYFWQNPKSGWNDADGVAAVCQRTGATFCRYLPSFVIERERQRQAQ